jgi:hypothetical protein
MLWNANQILIALLILGVFLAAIETGYRFGKRHHPEAEEAGRIHISALQGHFFASVLICFSHSWQFTKAIFSSA